MIDYIKAYTYDVHIAARLRNTICTKVEVDHTTGDLTVGEYYGKCSQFKIKVYESGRIQISGSLHKYHSGGQNYSDFTINQVRQTIYSLCELIGINPEKTYLENIEFGVNINLSYPTSILLGSIVSLPCGILFNNMEKGEGKNAKRTEYRHKIYNKGKQYSIGSNLLRYEIHVDKMRFVYPVKTLQDLCEYETWVYLQTQLVKQFNQIVFTDSYNLTLFKKRELNFYHKQKDKINNARYWESLKPIERHRTLTRLKKIQLKSEHNFSETTSEMIYNKINDLKNVQQFHSLNIG